MLSRAVSRVIFPSARSIHSTSVLSARKNKSFSRISIKRGVRDTQSALNEFDFSEFRDDEDEESPIVRTTKLKEAMKQLNDPNSLEMDKIPLAKKGMDDDYMTEEELEAFFDEDDDDDDDDDEFESELQDLEDEENKKRVKSMFTPGRAMKTLREPEEKKKQKNAIPLQKEENARFNPDLINHRQQRVGQMLESFIQDVIQRETDLCRDNTQVWVTHINMSPDLRRAVVYWDVTTLSHAKVSKTIEKRVTRRLDTMGNWLRVRVTQQLGLKYTPKIEFKRQDNTSLERQKKFDQIMALYGY